VTADQMLVHVVDKIRQEYQEDVPIILRMDAGFYDDELFETCGYLNIGYLCGGKQYRNVFDEATDAVDWQPLKKSR